ncbi:hypothetical protein [Goodfellowiella coeruleoviolacea]|uniref:VWFA domain-containing protein n=1 Tax=Goodfellowiella coeruleoviolacea TaxID=334858 RepID=A0AAE3GJI3_9PSEU|nr:hypothetical protein [Goodfellowiella coeruleoviolacea]MCP2167293.1 hypothetical protein [Goodfellowiella coeruleoviolacea]
MGPAPTRPTCPVCRHNATDARVCARCGWTLATPPWLDLDAEADVTAFAAELAARRRAFDLAAAALAAGFPVGGDTALFTRLAGRVRGGRPDSAELASATRDAPAPPEGQPVAALVAPAVARLVGAADRARTLAVLDVHAEGVTVARLGVDAAGVPSVVEPVRLVGWREVLPGLPPTADDLLLALAGGVGASEDVPDPDRARPPAVSADEVLVLHRLAGWPVPDAVAARLGTPHPVRRGQPPLDEDAAAAWAALAPLRHDYRLVLVAVDGRGATRPVSRRLFASGTSAAGRPVASVAVTGPVRPAALHPVLAVVTGPPGTPPRQCAPVAVFHARLRPNTRDTLEFRLDGPGRVALLRPDGEPAPEALATWPDVLDDVPAVYRPDAHAADVVFAVELCGRPLAAAQRRRDLVAEAIDHLGRVHPAPDSVRVAVLGYRDHVAQGPRALAGSRRFGTVAEAAAVVAGLAAGPLTEPWAAPVEDALARARRLDWRPAPVARRLVIVGSRPPHLDYDASAPRCPHGCDWRRDLALLDNLAVHHVAVWDRPAWSERDIPEARQAIEAWRAFGLPRLPLLLDRVDAARVVREARVVPKAAPTAPLLFPLPVPTDTSDPEDRR